MGLRAILTHPDPVLRMICDRVERFDQDMRDMAADMLDTMYAAPGRGLAAPQVGVPLRLFVMDAGWKEGEAAPLVCANPVITALGSETHTEFEQCLSIPDHPVAVTRPAHVLLRFYDLTAKLHEVELTGDAAVIAQHEADHLDGRRIVDFEGAAQ